MLLPRGRKHNFGFTLIELLIVIAILGVLGTVVFLLVDPVERQAAARDAGRLSAVVQIGNAMQSYYTSNAEYPPTANWASDLLSSAEISAFPAGIKYSAYNVTACTTFVQPALDPTFCYDLDATNGFIVFTKAEAQRQSSKCTLPALPYFVFSSADARGGTICSANDPTPWVSGSQSYVD